MRAGRRVDQLARLDLARHLPKVAQLCYPAATLVIHIRDNCVEVFGPDGPFQIWLGGFDEKERVDYILGGSNLMPSQAASG
jgi:hypothetical protein